MKTRNKAGWLGGAALAALMLLEGCTYSGDTSGFKPEKKQTKAEITKQIEDVKANPNMPEGVKGMALKKLQKDLETAQ